jgi:hypothetical protein
MTDQNHYAKLGVDENSSFEEIQDARNFLVQEHSSDRRQVEAIEAAYDAILMDRLRLRQEGKIKVPDRIRFPERLVEPPSTPVTPPPKPTPDWLKRFIDTPSRADVLLPAGLFLTTALLSLSFPPVALAAGVGFSFYFLNRKERKFGRSLLLTIAGLIGGVFLGLQLAALLAPQLASLALTAETFAAIVTFFILWLISSFLR